MTSDELREGFEVEYRIRRPDGSVRYLRDRGFPVKDADGTVCRIVGISQDVTLKKVQELSLQREKATEHALTRLTEKLLTSKSIEEASKLIWNTARILTDSEKGFIGRLDSRSGHFQMYSFTAGQSKEVHLEGEPEKWGEQVEEWYGVLGKHSVLHENTCSSNQTQHQSIAGRVGLRSLLSAPVFIGDRFMGQICLADAEKGYDERDLRLAKRLASFFALTLQRNDYEKDIIESKLEAERANKAKSDFLAKMSHEIRTPMNAIMGMLNIALDSLVDAEHRENLTTAVLAAENLMGIIDNILDLSKIEAGMMTLSETHFDLSALLAETMVLAKHQVKEKNIALSLDLAPDVPAFIKGDRTRLRQVLINILSNAVKFTEKGEVVLGVRNMPSLTELVLQFRVSDTGTGIPLDGHNKVFSKFVQLDDSTTRKFGGSGLGLAICKQLVELMGGDIWLESTLGQGSTFYFTIRCESGLASLANLHPGPVFPDKNAGESLRVLVVDDNESNLKVAAALLRRLGHEPHVAESALAAFRHLRESRFDVVLMDLEMPDMDGLEATRGIRSGKAGEENVDIPIIALTAHALAGFKERCLEAGMRDFLPKPVDIHQLAAKLGSVEALENEVSHSVPLLLSGDAVLDRQEAVRRFDGDETLYDEISTSFFADLPDRLQKIETLLQQREQSLLTLTLHSLKSQCGTIGAKYAHNYVALLESKSRAGDFAGVSSGMDELKRVMKQLSEEFFKKNESK